MVLLNDNEIMIDLSDIDVNDDSLPEDLINLENTLDLSEIILDTENGEQDE